MRLGVGRLAALLLTFAAMQAAGYAQDTPPNIAPDTRLDQPAASGAPFTLHVTTREVVVEVVATGSHGVGITDLTAAEFQVFTIDEHGHKVTERVAAARLVGPAGRRASTDEPANIAMGSGGSLVAVGRTCATRMTPYYAVAFHVGIEARGYHDILVRTTRGHIKLAFRSRFYVGATEPPAKPLYKSAAEERSALQRAACYHADSPDSINLTGRAFPTGDIDGVQFSIIVPSDSLAFTSLMQPERKAQLDYGICSFNAAGIPQRYMETTEDRVLTSSEYAEALAHGFQKLMVLQRVGDPVYARIVVRDRELGNVGSIGIAIPPVPEELRAAGATATGGVISVGSALQYRDRQGNGPVSGFGLAVPRTGAFCGDVYELPERTRVLPDFWKMEPIGALYIDALNVPPQPIMGTVGIPGVTARTAWFAIDYWGRFWVQKAGTYAFLLTSDDGSELYIDGTEVINLDSVHGSRTLGGKITLKAGPHVIHVPYFQGPPVSVSLVLMVLAPGSPVYEAFDVNDFPAPPGK